MKIAFFDTHGFEKSVFQKANESTQHEIAYFETRLTEQTAKLSFWLPLHLCICKRPLG